MKRVKLEETRTKLETDLAVNADAETLKTTIANVVSSMTNYSISAAQCVLCHKGKAK